MLAFFVVASAIRVVIFKDFKNQAAGNTIRMKVAQSAASEAQARQEAAGTKAAVAEGNAAAAQAGEQAVANRATADAAAAQFTDDELNEALRRQGVLREDDTK